MSEDPPPAEPVPEDPPLEPLAPPGPGPALTPEEIAAGAGEVVTVPAEQWRSMQSQLEEMEQRQRELLAALGSVSDHSNKTITGLQERMRGLEELQVQSSRSASPIRSSSIFPDLPREPESSPMAPPLVRGLTMGINICYCDVSVTKCFLMLL